MSFSDARTGGTGFVAQSIESVPGGSGTPGVAVTPTGFIPAVSAQIKAVWDMVKPEVMRGTRLTQAIMERARLKISGTIDWELNPSLGMEYVQGALGGTTTLAAVSASTTGAVTTTNGISTIPVSGAFVPGAVVLVNAATLTAPSTAPTVATSTTGGTGLAASTAYTYEVTFLSKYGETTVGPASAAVTTGTGTTNSNSLSAIPTGPAGTTGRNIYRASGGAYALVDAIADNTTTTWTDTGSETAGAAPPASNTANAAGSSTEIRQVVSYASGSLTVGALTTNATAASGIGVSQPAQTKYANSLLPAGYTNALPTLTVESNKGGEWAWRFPGTFVNELQFTMAKSDMKVQASVMGSADPIYCTATTSPAMVSYSPNATDEKNALRPLTSIDGFVVAAGDPDATGTSSLRAALGVTDVKLMLKNGLIEEPCFNGTHTYEIFPGDKATLEVDYTEIATAKRPDVWTDYIEASQSTSFLVAASKNYGTASAPDFGAVAFYVPTLKYSDAEDDEKIGAVDTFVRKAMALAPPGAPADYLQVFVLKP